MSVHESFTNLHIFLNFFKFKNEICTCVFCFGTFRNPSRSFLCSARMKVRKEDYCTVKARKQQKCRDRALLNIVLTYQTLQVIKQVVDLLAL